MHGSILAQWSQEITIPRKMCNFGDLFHDIPHILSAVFTIQAFAL